MIFIPHSRPYLSTDQIRENSKISILSFLFFLSKMIENDKKNIEINSNNMIFNVFFTKNIFKKSIFDGKWILKVSKGLKILMLFLYKREDD